MLKNTSINLRVIQTIAHALGDLNDKIVYVGGAVVSLYINNPAAEDVRPTKDIDIGMELLSLGQLEQTRLELIRRGFRQTAEDDVMCRFRYGDIKVDVMSTKAVGWAPANPWFASGFASKEPVIIHRQQIHILPLAYFLASKFAAFNDRGTKDPRTSHDFEDIIYIFDNRTDIAEQILQAAGDVRQFLIAQLRSITEDRIKQEAIYGNLYYDNRQERFNIIFGSINKIIHGH
jgi:predicted nucleotidyltransferase